jgi:hypothetical protein
MTEDEGREHVGRLETAHPCWLVFYGAYSRQFVAYPLFGAPEGTILIDSDPGALASRMRQMERTYGPYPPGSDLLTRVAQGIRNL